MYLIHERIWTYTEGHADPQKVDPSVIRSDPSCGHAVTSFAELTSKVATLGFLNRRWHLFFRGQAEDYHTPRGAVALYPSFYREAPDKLTLPRKEQRARFAQLTAKVDELRDRYPRHNAQSRKEFERLRTHYELCWSILQHYEIVATPYLDVTTSLRVAASFALLESSSAFIYVLACPYPAGSITHVVDLDLKMVRLQAACPPSAKRPHFQEGFLIGSCYLSPDENRANQNASRRLIAKFHIADRDGFWTTGRFDPIPRDALYPKPDNDFGWLGKIS